MKRTQQPVHQQHIVRRVLANRETQQSSVQMTAVKKINNLLQSGSVSVTTQPKINKPATTVKCFVCDDYTLGSLTSNLTEITTNTSQSKIPNKIAKVVGESFMVIVGQDDVICRRCLTLFNQMDKIESDLDRVKGQIKNFINKKYHIAEEDGPPVKIQKLNSGNSVYNRWQSNSDDSAPTTPQSTTITRKIVVSGEKGADSVKHLYSPNNSTNSSTNNISLQSPPQKRQQIKVYKCVSCDFKTTDLNLFQPHYDVCKGQQQNQMANRNKNIIKPVYSTAVVQKQQQLNRNQTIHVQEKHSPQQMGNTSITQMFSCKMCAYKTNDKNSFQDHQQKHIKMRPFKCRLCLERFETREAATIHAKSHTPAYFKCGICEMAFTKRENLQEHLKTHEKIKTVQKQDNKSNSATASTQKLLQDTINEALRDNDTSVDAERLRDLFFSCTLCPLTFLDAKIFSQHMKSHGNQVPRKQQHSASDSNTLSDGDLERIFEKLHSDSAHQTAANGATNDKNVLITTQESGGITYNITIPQDDIPATEEETHEEEEDEDQTEKTHKIGIDMPDLLGNNDDDDSQGKSEHSEHVQGSVNMPSLDVEDEDHTQSSQEEQQQLHEQNEMSQEHTDGEEQMQGIPMDLEDLQNANDGQLKFIVDENGQILQLDNHILTTDAEGNQILVQGSDNEHLQQLLQSVGVVVGNGEGMVDSDGNPLQMMDENSGSQMILVQGADGQEQLIDASMLQHEGGGIVIQQGADGETHLTTADGTPVSVSFGGQTTDGQITVTMATGNNEEQQYIMQQPMEMTQEQMEGHEEQHQMQMEVDGEVGVVGDGNGGVEGESQGEESQECEQVTVKYDDASSQESTHEIPLDGTNNEEATEVSTEETHMKNEEVTEITATEISTEDTSQDEVKPQEEQYFALGEDIMQPKDEPTSEPQEEEKVDK